MSNHKYTTAENAGRLFRIKLRGFGTVPDATADEIGVASRLLHKIGWFVTVEHKRNEIGNAVVSHAAKKQLRRAFRGCGPLDEIDLHLLVLEIEKTAGDPR